MFKKVLLSVFLLLVPSLTQALDFDLWGGSTKITLELAVKDTDGNNLGLPIKVVWKNEEKDKTYAIANFLENTFISISKTIPQSEVNGVLEFDTSTLAKAQKRVVLDQKYEIPLNYNFWGSAWTKSELFYVILERKGAEGYSIVDFYSQSDQREEEEEILSEAKVSISGTTTGSFYSRRDISVGLYNKRGEVLYIWYTDNQWEFQINLNDFQEKIELDTEYYLIYGKVGDIEDGEAGFLYKSKTYNFPSYINVVKTFEDPLNLSVEPNLKDQVVKESFPWIFLLVCLSIYLYFLHRIIIKKLIRKMFIHPFRREYRIVYNKRKNLIDNIMKNNLWKS